MPREIHKTVTASATRGATVGTNVFTLSTGDLDRDGDRIAPDGWNLEPYRRNPVVLFGHDRTGLPIGKCTDVRLVRGQLVGTVEWPPTGLYPFADQVRRMVDQGFLRAASVGFTCTDARANAYGGHDITAATLLEWSIVNLPSNPSATLQRSVDRVRLKSWLGGTWRDDRRESVLTLIDEPPSQQKETPMRHSYDRNDVVLRVKDDTITGPDQSVNLAEVTAKLLEQARAIDATFRTLGIDASIADLVRQQMAPDKLPQKMRGTNYLLKTYNAATQRAMDRDWCTRVQRAAEAEQAVPLAKRHKDGFARVY